MSLRLLKSVAFVNKHGVKNFSSSFQVNFKVAIVGAAGGIGQALGLLMKLNPLVTGLACYDLAPITPGVAVDLSHIDTPAKVTGHTGPDQLSAAFQGTNMVIVSAGKARKIEQTRDDLFDANANIMRVVATAMAKSCPEAVACIITNPVNSLLPLLSEVLKKESAYDPKRLFGVTTLDVVRSSTFIGEINGVDPRTVTVPVIGGHSLHTIVPVLSQSKPELKLTDPDKVKALFQRIQAAGHEVAVAKANHGTATLSMAFSAARLCISVLRGLSGEPNVVECSYVKSDVTEAAYFSNPLLLGKSGVEKNLGIPPLNDFEQEQLKKAMPHLLENIQRGIDYANKK